MSKPADKNYWRNELVPPYSPSEDDVAYYRQQVSSGTTLLLGCTHKLLALSTAQMDHDPWYEGSTVIVCDWRDNRQFYDNMIGDGVLNFTKELTDAVVQMASEHTKSLIVRSFNFKLPNMMIADYFPSEEDFAIRPISSFKKDSYSFYAWRF